jgi:hypothetical protein
MRHGQNLSILLSDTLIQRVNQTINLFRHVGGNQAIETSRAHVRWNPDDFNMQV